MQLTGARNFSVTRMLINLAPIVLIQAPLFILGVFSFVRLAQDGFKIEFGPFYLLVLQWYETNIAEAAAQLAFLEPWLNRFIDLLRPYFQMELELHQHWKHIFVLMMVYVGGRVKSGFDVGNYGAALLLASAGLLFAPVASALAGIAPLHPGSDGAVWNIVILVGPPALGLLLIDVSEIIWSSTVRRKIVATRLGDQNLTSWSIFLRFLRACIARFAISALLVLVGVAIVVFAPSAADARAPGLTVLLLATFSLGAYWLYQGVKSVAGRRADFPGKTWFEVYLTIGSTRVGWSIVRYVLAGVSVLVAGVLSRI